MNEEENFEQQQLAKNDTAVTPPPFRPSDAPYQGQEPTASPTLADRARAMGLDEDFAQQLAELTAGIPSEVISDDLLAMLARGISHDDDVQTADAAGYLRGRNEKIEAVLHPAPEDEDDVPVATPVFPRYCRRSVWE